MSLSHPFDVSVKINADLFNKWSGKSQLYQDKQNLINKETPGWRSLLQRVETIIVAR